MVLKNLISFTAALTAALVATGCNAKGTWSQGLVFDHVLVIILENTNYKKAVNDPYLGALAKQGSLFSKFHGEFHPSYPNYLAMVGGSYFGTFLDIQKTVNQPSIVDLLEAKNLTWKNYAEGYPGGCFLGATSGRFARKHVPMLSFKSVQDQPERCAKVVPSEQFAKDVAANDLPNYAFYSPNLDDDGHDTGLTVSSKWLKEFLTPLLANQKFMERTLIEVTFDESQTYFNNHIYTLFLGPMVKPDFVESNRTGHYEVLRTIEENFGIGTLHKEDEEAQPILDIWTPEAISAAKSKISP